MPRYYFGYETETPESEGEELADDDAARAVARMVAEELGRHLPARPRISIFDAQGGLVAPAGGLVIEIGFPRTQH